MQFFVDLDPHSIFPKCDWMDGRTDTVAQQRLSPVASTYVECVMMAATCRMLGRSDVPADPSTA